MALTKVTSALTDLDGGITIDNITIDGTEIDLSSGDLTIDVAGDITLDADGGHVFFKDAGTQIGKLQNSSSDFIIESSVQDKDIIFKGDDGGSTITALTLDMSAAGFATFNSGVKISGDSSINRGNQTSGELLIGGTTDGGFVDFDGTALQLNTQRDPNTGTFINTAKSHSSIILSGADGGSHIRFTTASANNTTATERMRISSSGNVSIQTTAVSANGLNLSTGLNYSITEGANSSYVNLFRQASSAATVLANGYKCSSNNDAFASSFASSWAKSAVSLNYGTIRFYTDGAATTAVGTDVTPTERMRIDSSGNVGIGLTNPSDYYATSLVVSAAAEKGITIAATATNIANYLMFADGTSGDARYRGYIAYNHNSDQMAFASAGTERMFIDSSGNVMVATTSNQGVGGLTFGAGSNGVTVTNNTTTGAGNGHEFYVFRRNSTQIGSIVMSNTDGTTYATSSDARLKNVLGEAKGLEIVNKLNPVNFEWKESKKIQDGLIAQEVEELIPHAVAVSEEGHYSMDYSQVVTPLIKAIQEQQKEIEELKQNSHAPKTIEEMEGYEDLINRIKELENK